MKTGLVCLTAALLVASSLATANGEPSGGIPEKARQAMSFFVGAWEGETFENGEKIGASADRRSWAPGKHCLTVEGAVNQNGVEFRAAGVTGWDAKANAVIEYWHASGGESLMVCYPLETMKDNAWDGTHRLTLGDGKVTEGDCRLTKTPDGFEYVARWMEEGKEVVHRSVTRKVSAKKTATGSEMPSAVAAEPANIPARAIKAMNSLVGAWQGEDITDGKKLGTNRASWRWVPGKYCLRIQWSGTHDGSHEGMESQFAGICGWDARAGAVVEHWYGSQGHSLTNCYPLDKMKENVWEGTFAFTAADGKRSEGECQFTTMPDEGVWIGRSTKDGKEVIFKSVSHRVKPENVRDSVTQRAKEPPASHQHLKALGDAMVGDWEGETVPWVDEAKDTEKAKKVFLRCSIRWPLGGAALEERGTVGDGGFRGLEVWDGDSQQIKRFVVNSDGGVAEGTIVNRSGKWIFQETYVSADGKTRRSHTATMTIGADGDTVTFVHDPVVIDGKPQKGYQDVLRRLRR
ncbi:MAG: hypothetical protein GXY83_38865 [Rhodopirellula sp.]|nr:hypothetical protein [Rhodopirellula sp.]